MANKIDYRELRQIINANHDRFSSLNFDNDMSLLQKMNSLAEWFKVVLKEFNDVVAYLDEFQEKFDEKLYNTVDSILEEWVANERFNELIFDVFGDELKKLNNSLNTLNTNKVNKNGVEEIKYTNLSQGIKEMLAGNGTNVPVVAKDAVSTENVVNNSITTNKVTKLVQNGKFISSQPIVFDFTNGTINFPDGTFVSGRYSETVDQQSLTGLDTSRGYLIYYDTTLKTFVTFYFQESIIVPQDHIFFGSVQFPEKNVIIDGYFTGNRVNNTMLPYNFQRLQINASRRKFIITLDGENSTLSYPECSVLVGNSVIPVSTGTVTFDISTTGNTEVYYIVFDTSNATFYVLNSRHLSRITSTSSVAGVFHKTTFYYNFPVKLVIDGRAEKNIEITSTNNPSLMTFTDKINISFYNSTITIPSRIAMLYYNEYIDTPTITGGNELVIDIPIDIYYNKFLYYDTVNKNFYWLNTATVSQSLENSIFILWVNTNEKTFSSPFEISLENQEVINGKNYSFNTLNEMQSVSGTIGKARVDVYTVDNSVTEFNFLAKQDANMEEVFEIRFYLTFKGVTTDAIAFLRPSTKDWAPYKIKINTPFKGVCKMICRGSGKIKNVNATNFIPQKTPKEFQKILSLSHRGSNYYAPENTIEAFKMSNEMGFSGNEFDVELTLDGVWVLSHDSTIDRCSNGTGTIRDMTYNKLLEYDFGYKLRNIGYKDIKIPTLKEVLIFHAKAKQIPYIELKNNCINSENAQAFIDLLHETGVYGNCYISSFDLPMLKLLSNLDNKLYLGWSNLPNENNIAEIKSLGENAFCSIYGFDKTNFSSYEPFADLCLANNIKFSGSSNYLHVQEKIISKGAFVTALDDLNVSDMIG